jgi:hypothetical protein
MKTKFLQTNEMQHYLGKESALGVIGGGESVVRIKSLIHQSKEMHLGHRVAKFS